MSTHKIRSLYFPPAICSKAISGQIFPGFPLSSPMIIQRILSFSSLLAKAYYMTYVATHGHSRDRRRLHGRLEEQRHRAYREASPSRRSLQGPHGRAHRTGGTGGGDAQAASDADRCERPVEVRLRQPDALHVRFRVPGAAGPLSDRGAIDVRG